MYHYYFSPNITVRVVRESVMIRQKEREREKKLYKNNKVPITHYN